LKVRARGAVIRAAAAGERDPRDLGRELEVEVVVEGSVRKAGDKLRITTRLIGVADGFQLWAKRFDRPASDVFAIDEEAAREIADALTVDLAVPVRAAPTDPVALDLFLRARHRYNSYRSDELQEAVALFEQ